MAFSASLSAPSLPSMPACPLTFVNFVNVLCLRSSVVIALIRSLFAVLMYPWSSVFSRFLVKESMQYCESVSRFRCTLVGVFCIAANIATSSPVLLVCGRHSGSRMLRLWGSAGPNQTPLPAIEFQFGPLIQDPSV